VHALNAKKYPTVTANVVKSDERKTIEEFGVS